MEPKFEFSQDFIDAMKGFSAMFNEQQREATVMLEGFIKLNERDVDYMDRYMDHLFDFMEAGSDTEELIHRYYDYIATFDPQEAKHRYDELEEHLGYKTHIVFAAGLLAKELHIGQKDKGGNDYFTSHLMKVGLARNNWKEQVCGFLHDATENIGVSLDELINKLQQKWEEITKKPEDEWWEEWMEDVMPFHNDIPQFLSPEETDKIKHVFNLLNHHNSVSREEYIEKIKTNRLAMEVKINDLESNMDLSRIPNPTNKDLQRLERYKKEYEDIRQALYKLLDKECSIKPTESN
ncbi:MAG: hypothetical protein J1E16_00325 [Muribaculaceae bacterium]|nr:hypothetical protein [Muribaculaceae bacterium]